MNRLRALFFGSKLKTLAAVSAVLAVTIGGAVAVGVLGVPSIAAIDNTFGEVTEETTVVETDLVVSNPNPFGVSAGNASVTYALAMNDVEMARGETRDVAVDSGNSTVDLTTELDNGAIPAWWVSHVDNGERTTTTIDATVRSNRLDRQAGVTHEHEIETDVIGEFNSAETRPVNANQPLVDDPVLYVNETRAEWGAVDESETPIEMTFVMHNPNAEPYVITELGYDIAMNDVAVGEGATHETHVIGGGETEAVDSTTAIDAQRLDEWWVTHLDETVHGHQVSELRIEFYAVVELPTGEAVTVPLDELTYEETIETDVFDEGLEHGSHGGDDADANSDEDPSSDDPDANESAGGDGEADDESRDGEGDEESDGEGDDEGAADDEADDGGVGLPHTAGDPPLAGR